MGASPGDYLATYFGLSERVGGATIDAGPFIPSSELYQQAIDRFPSAMDYVDTAVVAEIRLLNSVIARTHLYNGNVDLAGDFAADGLVPGDPPFVALYNPQSSNPVRIGAGRQRRRFAAAPQFSAPTATT